MSESQLSIETLPAWLTLNDVSFFDVAIRSVPGKGYGLVAERKLSTVEDTYDAPTLLSIPSLALNTEAVEQYAKEDRDFRQLLDAAGHQSKRGDVLLFLLVQLALSLSRGAEKTGISNPWTQYVKFLPRQVPVPTLWTESERQLLRGTSLESAVNAKLLALEKEYDRLQEMSSNIPRWQAAFWDDRTVHLGHWFLLDAWYRSRSLELPRSGESMVPCLDMVNHSSTPNAYFEENSKDEVVLFLRPQGEVSRGDEITISYGGQKSAAEMLFSYGFIDAQGTDQSMAFPLEPMEDDPLAKAKLYVFEERPTVKFTRTPSQDVHWESSFAYLLCVNEEDGLEFRVLQETSGSRQLQIFWQDVDVTRSAQSFDTLTKNHDLRAIFQLRVVIMIQSLVESQLERMRTPADLDLSLNRGVDLIRDECATQANLLRETEKQLLEQALTNLEEEKSQLLADENVVTYLGSMEASPKNDSAEEESSNEEDDFS